MVQFEWPRLSMPLYSFRFEVKMNFPFLGSDK